MGSTHLLVVEIEAVWVMKSDALSLAVIPLSGRATMYKQTNNHSSKQTNPRGAGQTPPINSTWRCDTLSHSALRETKYQCDSEHRRGLEIRLEFWIKACIG